MRYYAVIDTNVLVSAMLKWQSVPGSIMEFTMSGVIVPVLNREIVDEYRNVLLRPKFGLTSDIIKDIIDSLENAGFYIDRDPIDIDLPDPKDRIFYEIVMKERNENDAYLVTGNIKHFPNEPFIVTPRKMMDIILSDLNASDENE